MADKTFRPRRGSSTTMDADTSTVLKAGEMFFEYPSGGVGTGECKIKMGDGSTTYSSLPYAIDLSTVARVSTAGTAVGAAAKPVYVNSSGVVTACSSTVGSGTKPVYMSSGTITASGSTVGSASIPVYISSGTITSTNIDLSKRVSVSTAGTAVGSASTPVYVNSSGVATTCTVVNNTSSTAITAAASLATNNTIYYGLPTINGSHSYTSSTNIYAPTSVGTSGYVLTSSGTGAPSWTAQSSITAGSASTATTATNATNVYSTVSTGTTGTYYFDFHSTASSANKALKHSANVNLYIYAGTTTANGYERVSLGNSTASGTADNSYGQLRMYGTGTYYALLSGGQALTANRTFYFPNAGGTLVTHPTWGTAVGSSTKPVYISSTGVATALSSTVGSSTTPVYLSSGTITSTGVNLSTVGQSQGYLETASTSTSKTLASGTGYAVLSRNLYDWTNFSSSYYCVLIVDMMFVLGSASGTAGTRIIYGMGHNGGTSAWNTNEITVDTTVFRASSTQRLHYSTIILLNSALFTTTDTPTIDAYIQQDSGVSVTLGSALITAFYYPIATDNVHIV